MLRPLNWHFKFMQMNCHRTNTAESVTENKIIRKISDKNTCTTHKKICAKWSEKQHCTTHAQSIERTDGRTDGRTHNKSTQIQWIIFTLLSMLLVFFEVFPHTSTLIIQFHYSAYLMNSQRWHFLFCFVLFCCLFFAPRAISFIIRYWWAFLRIE